MLENIILSFFAAVGLISLLAYELITLFDLMDKEDWIEKCYKTILPKRKFDKEVFILLIRPCFLMISMIGMVPMGIIREGPLVMLYELLLYFSIFLAIGHLLKYWRK